ncbi:hypothetical protein LOAG_07129 [Loa loa]|uniref:UPAR/Ly6 domain-containing protein n=1 Tax=Loa loa TaxID=7209 RepID=A0A1S0TWG3_LOALO|nr:hypothetical protein LOAG_07129 [Loa loa]EFO21358.1 hypothetical protein LOAG_07129 [Loa loa]
MFRWTTIFWRLGNGGSFAEVLCPAASNFCMKRHFAIQYNEDIIEKTCGQNSQCYKVGNGCHYDSDNAAEYCCCDTDSCNGATVTTTAFSLLIGIVSCVICTTFIHMLF